MKTIIPASNWTTHLADAIESSSPGDEIVVGSGSEKQLGISAAARMSKAGLTFTVQPRTVDHPLTGGSRPLTRRE